jgi:broad specificity phosphatase PhoE
MPLQLYLIRHGETAWSLSGQHTSRTDLSLTKNGERCAAELKSRLSGIQFSHVWVSPLQRARQTCEIAGFTDSVKIEPDLTEWDYGDFEGRTTVDIHTSQPAWDLFSDGAPGGESVSEISLRADRVLAQVRLLDGRVALFSHGHFLRVLAVRWLQWDVARARHFLLDTGSVSILAREHQPPNFPVISVWNAVPSPASAR